MFKKLLFAVTFFQLVNFNLISDSIIFYRHATFVLKIDNKKILVDPMLAPIGEYPPIVLSKNDKRNPLIQLDVELNEITDVDGVLITHDHNDHFDEVSKEVLNKNIPILCQPSDYKNILKFGFKNVTKIKTNTEWLGLKIERFKGTHGGGIFNFLLEESSAYLIRSKTKNIYVTGDTLLTKKQRKVLKELNPDIVIANGGNANLKLLGKITMDNNDILEIKEMLPYSKIIAIHMDSINHCGDTRDLLIKKANEKKLNIEVPISREQIKL